MASRKAARRSRDYWNRRVLVDKAQIINNAEDFLLRNQSELYGKAEKEIQQEIEKLYQKFSNQQNISLAEARRLIRGADFQKIDWDGMMQQSLKLREQIKNGKGNLPEDVIRNLEEQHKKLEDQLKAFAKRGRISILELKQIEIDRKLLSLYDDQQQNIYDYLHSEYEDGYYRQVYNTQQMQGFGFDFIHPNEEAIDKAILNQYQRQNFSQTLYKHCEHFSKDLRENLVVGMIRGESLDKMASRIKKRMGVAYSAAKTLVRTETAYVYEQATKDAYEQCGIEWYEYLATLDNKTSEMCRELDGKHFKVKDALPGKNYPPMHPNCRSTTVCWFPDESKEKKKQTTRIAKDEGGKYYEVPADMTYKQWASAHGNWKKMLTHENKRAINQYISFDAYRINDKLRNNSKLDVIEQNMRDQLDDALDKLPNYEGNVIRCLEIKDKRAMEVFLKSHEVGNCVEYKEYTSCSADEGYDPSANVIIYRTSKNGKDLRSFNMAENEILYKRNSRFEILNCVEKEGIIYILEEEK